MGTATLVKKIEGWKGEAALYRMDPPHEGEEYVIASAVIAAMDGPETFLFPATKDGEAKDYGEMDGSRRGTLNHHTAMAEAGYQIVD